MAQAAVQALRDEPDKFSPGTNAFLGACMIADLPFSAIADTLALPVTIKAALSGKEDTTTAAHSFIDPFARLLSLLSLP
jgi:hypothetical protein